MTMRVAAVTAGRPTGIPYFGQVSYRMMMATMLLDQAPRLLGSDLMSSKPELSPPSVHLENEKMRHTFIRLYSVQSLIIICAETC